jgi:hypothetical protein
MLTTAIRHQAASTAESPVVAVERRLRDKIRLHFHQRDGAAFWIDRARSLGVDAVHDIASVADLRLLGDMTPADLCARPLLDYIPRALHGDLPSFIVGQTGGTTGPANSPWTAYRQDEFEEAFIQPFAVAARHAGFPRCGRWLYAGPSGPHIIGKVVRRLAQCVDSPDPFSIDFDPRWARKLPPESFALARYLGHVVEQCLPIIVRQEVDVIFTTPVVLRHLAGAMTEQQRLAIRGVHYGGMALSRQDLHDFQITHFPNAVHISGYGNTLFGCCMELHTDPGRALEYFPFGARLLLDVVSHGASGPDRHSGTLPGRVRFTRLDDSMLIINMLERDCATVVVPPAPAPTGFGLPGVGDPHSPQTLEPDQRPGIY